MSENQNDQMIIECYKNVQIFYERWRKQLQRTISKIRSISGDIQNLERSTKNGTIACSSFGIVSGVMTVAGLLGAPFTFGGSLSLTVVGTGIGLGFGALGTVHTWIKSSDIQSKCKEASTLLEVSENCTTEFYDVLTELNKVKKLLGTRRGIDHTSFNGMGVAMIKGGDALVDAMIRRKGAKVCAELGVYSSKTVVAPMAASEFGKRSLRCIGVAAVGIGILMDVADIAKNVNALDSKKLSYIVDTLEKAANEMEDNMKKSVEMYVTPSIVQNRLT